MEPSVRNSRRWIIVILLVAMALWAVLAWGVMPSLIRKAYAGESIPVLSRAFDHKGDWPVEHYLGRWNKLALLVLMGTAGTGALLLITTSAWFARRIVGLATPGTLGAMRMFICALAAWYAWSMNLSAVAAKPPSSRTSMGIMDALYKAPVGLSSIVQRETALQALQAVTVAALLLAAAGLRTRWTVILGTVLYLLVGGIVRSYAKFNHSGLIPLYAMAVLCFTHCGDGWSLDRWIRERRGQPVPSNEPQAHYAWGRYGVWCVVAIAYVCAGLSKLGNGGLFWWDSTNMRRLLYEEAFHLGAGNDDIALQLTWVPSAAFAVMGLGTIALELGMGLTLISKWARRLVPAMVVLMHLGIEVIQRIPFFDLMLIQVIFYDWSVPRRWLQRRIAGSRGSPDSAQRPQAEDSLAAAAGDEPVAANDSVPRRAWRSLLAPAGVVALTVLFLGAWAVRLEEYPLTSWQMFSSYNNSGLISYYKLYQVNEEGRIEYADNSQISAVGPTGQLSLVFWKAFRSKSGEQRCRQLLIDGARRWNQTAPPGKRITAFRLVRREWDFKKNRHDPNYGVERQSLMFPLDPSGEASLARSPQQ